MARIKNVGHLNLGCYGRLNTQYKEDYQGKITTSFGMTLVLDNSLGACDETISYYFDGTEEFNGKIDAGFPAVSEEAIRTPRVIREAFRRLSESWNAERCLLTVTDISLMTGHDPGKEIGIMIDDADLGGRITNGDRLLQSIARKLNRYIAQASK